MVRVSTPYKTGMGVTDYFANVPDKTLDVSTPYKTGMGGNRWWAVKGEARGAMCQPPTKQGWG